MPQPDAHQPRGHQQKDSRPGQQCHANQQHPFARSAQEHGDPEQKIIRRLVAERPQRPVGAKAHAAPDVPLIAEHRAAQQHFPKAQRLIEPRRIGAGIHRYSDTVEHACQDDRRYQHQPQARQPVEPIAPRRAVPPRCIRDHEPRHHEEDDDSIAANIEFAQDGIVAPRKAWVGQMRQHHSEGRADTQHIEPKRKPPVH